MKKLGVFGILALFLMTTTALAQSDAKRNDGKRKGRGANGGGAINYQRVLSALDKDKDGTISKTEAPARMKERFDQMDGNKDGALDADELKRAFARRGQRDGQPGPGNAAGAKGKKGSAAGKDAPRPGGGRGLDLAAIFKAGDTDGDGNLNPAEQKAIIARVNQMMQRFRQMRGGDGKQKKGGDRYSRPNTDPVKPKRPGMKD